MQLLTVGLAIRLAFLVVASAGSQETPALRGARFAAGTAPVPVASAATGSQEREVPEPSDGQRAIGELRAVTVELRTKLVSALPTLLNATAAASLPANLSGTSGPGVEILQAAALLQADVVKVLPDFLQATVAVEDAGTEQLQQPLVTFEHVAGELRKTVTRRFLPAFLSAARDLLRDTTGPLLHAMENHTIENELATLAELLAYFMKRSVHASWPNAPACVSDIAASVADLVKGAQEFKYSSNDCTGAWRSPLDCAGDVAVILQRFADASSLIGDAAFDCGASTKAGCQEATASTYASLVSAASQGVVATADCVWPLSDGLASVDWCETAVTRMEAAFEEFGEHSLEAVELCGPSLDQAARALLERIAFDVTEELARVLPRIESALQGLQR